MFYPEQLSLYSYKKQTSFYKEIEEMNFSSIDDDFNLFGFMGNDDYEDDVDEIYLKDDTLHFDSIEELLDETL